MVSIGYENVDDNHDNKGINTEYTGWERPSEKPLRKITRSNIILICQQVLPIFSTSNVDI